MFRAIDQWGNLGPRGLRPQSINLVLKSRYEKASLDAAKYSAHGLRSGYLTEAANRGVPLQEAMQQSQHKSMAQATANYNEQDRRRGKAARVLIQSSPTLHRPSNSRDTRDKRASLRQQEWMNAASKTAGHACAEIIRRAVPRNGPCCKAAVGTIVFVSISPMHPVHRAHPF